MYEPHTLFGRKAAWMPPVTWLRLRVTKALCAREMVGPCGFLRGLAPALLPKGPGVTSDRRVKGVSFVLYPGNASWTPALCKALLNIEKYCSPFIWDLFLFYHSLYFCVLT